MLFMTVVDRLVNQEMNCCLGRLASSDHDIASNNIVSCLQMRWLMVGVMYESEMRASRACVDARLE